MRQKKPHVKFICKHLDLRENTQVRLLVSILFTALFILGLTNVSSVGASTKVTKIKIVHTHKHSEQHSHHKEGPHTHEIVLVSSVVFVSVQPTVFIALAIPADIYSVPSEDLPPNNPNLASIFRPPIA